MDKEHEISPAPEEETSDEIDFEPEEELGSLGAAQAKIKKIKAELAKIKTERQEYLDGWQRCKAETVNARRESIVTAERVVERTRESIIAELVPVLDSFDMAAGNEAWENVDAAWRSGIEFIKTQLLDVLARNGVERYGKAGEKFDHALHEAIEERDDTPGAPGEIIRVLRAGYRIGDRILRPAQVVVKV